MHKKIIIISSIIIGILIFGNGAFFAYQKFGKKEVVVKKEAPVEKNYFEINDETVGVYFRVSKNFDRLPVQELHLKNSNFIHGFSAKNDKTVYCIVSQTKRETPGGMRAVDLRDGVLAQIKKSFSDATLEAEGIVEIGEKNNKGVKLTINYTDNNIPMVQQEVVGITDAMATFAFCATPKAVVELYQEDFNLFLDSLKIK